MGSGPCWWDKPLRVLQFNFEDRLGLFVPRIRARDLVQVAKRIHANMIVVFARDAWGYTYYRGSRAGPPRPGLPGDFLRELVEEAHGAGIRVVAMVAHTANKLLYLKHSDWGQVNYRGEPVLLEHAPASGEWAPEWPLLCPNSPFLGHALMEVREVLDLGVDGVFFDSFRYQPDPEKACYCKWCRARFSEEYGYDMPTVPDWDNSVWRLLWDWRYRVVVEALRELSMEAKRRNPGAHVMYNSHPGGWAGRTNRVVEYSRGFLDGVFAECSEADFEPPGFIAEMVKLTRAMAGPGVKVYASRNAFHSLKPTMPAPGPVIRQGLREAIIAGGEPWVLVFSSMLVTHRSFIEDVGKVFREHEALEEYIEGSEPLTYAAILVSNKVRDHYGRLSPETYVDEIRGFYYMLQHLHLPVEFIAESDVAEKHDKYDVIILADTACTGKELIGVLRDRARSGKAVVASHKTSLYDGDCLPAGGLLAGDVLGAELVAEPLSLEWLYVEPVERGALGLQEPLLVGDNPRDLSKPWHLASIVPVKPLKGFRAPLRLRLPGYRYGQEYTLGRSSPPIGPALDAAGAVLGEKTIYYPWRIGSNYWASGYPAYRDILLGSLTQVGATPPIEARAPSTVITTYWRQGERIIVHLLNYTSNQRILTAGFTGAKQPLPGYSSGPPIHPVTEIIPVHGIEIRVSKSLIQPPIRAYTVLGRDDGAKVGVEEGDDHVIVHLDRLDEYEVLVLEPTH